MIHSAHGYWLEEVPDSGALEPLRQDVDVDVAIVGGGYTGLWTAWQILAAEPDAEVVVIDSGRCGFGPSGRNGGFANSMWFSLATMRERFDAEAAVEIATEASRSVHAIGDFCEAEGVDAWYRRAGYLQVSAADAQEGEWDEAVVCARELSEGGELPAGAGRELSADQVAERCRSPLFRGGAFYADAATVQPARLAMGLRDAVVRAGGRVHERTRCVALKDRGGRAELTLRGGLRIRADQAVLACGGASLRFRPFRRSLTVSSSHIVLTEPVPDLLEEIGWTGGECITDSRHMIHYFRTTPDGRIAFGWGGGRVALGSRLGGRAEVDPDVVEQVRKDAVRFFHGLEGRRFTHAWGGPIDISPSHVPIIESSGERIRAAFGYTGNGVGPSHMLGRILASLALDRRDALSRIALVDPDPVKVPPEPFRWLGGSIIRRALLAREAAEEQGRKPSRLASAVASIPEKIGVQVGR